MKDNIVNKTVTVSARIGLDDYRKIKSIASKEGKRVSEFLREMILKKNKLQEKIK